MSSPSGDKEEPSSSTAPADEGPGGSGSGAADARPPAKRRFSSTVIEISDTESDDSDVCAVNSYQASADEVKRIRGADNSSTSSSSEYSSDSEDSGEDDSILVENTKSDLKAIKAQLNPRANRMDDPLFNTNFKSQELIDRLSLHWKEQKDFKSGEVILTCEPYRLCLLRDFLTNPEMINNIVDDMNTLDWFPRKMDLYEFHQTDDLSSLTWQRSIRGIYELLQNEVMGWVSQVTGLELHSISATCSLYGPGDHLLVHDDLMKDRRVAFIFYLAPWRPSPKQKTFENGSGDSHESADLQSSEGWGGWSRAMGGALQLLSRDDLGLPLEVVHSATPRNNTLAFFKLGGETFHQVEEVLSLDLPRLSINGWFHGPAPPTDPTNLDLAPLSPAEVLRPHSDIVVLSQWLEATYMSPRSRMQIQSQMERESEVCLRNLLPEDKLRELVAALEDPEVPWEPYGPANQRHYSRVPHAWVNALPPSHPLQPLRGVLALFSSGAWLRALAECTDLTLATYTSLELQRWQPGCYSLLPPKDFYSTPRLEAVLYLRPCPAAAAALAGGHTTYLAPGEAGGGDAALVRVPVVHNALSLVYCDPGAASFAKYVNRMARRRRPAPAFYVLTCSYHE